MRIGIQTWGSHGDVRPLMALAGGLRAAGHEVTLLVTNVYRADYDAVAAELGVALRYVASPVITDADEIERIGETVFREANPLRQARAIISEVFLPAADEMFDAARALCRDSDLVVGHFFHYPVRIAAEIEGRPYASVTLVHSIIPTRSYPPAGMPDLGRLGNRLSWRLARYLFNRHLKPFADGLRVRNGLKPARDLVDDVWASSDLNLIAVSEVFCRRQDDWSANHRVCGHFNLPSMPGHDRELTPEIEQFLGDGAPPVYVTFGSATPWRGGALDRHIALLSDAAQAAQCRMIVQLPAVPEAMRKTPSSIQFVTAMPHARIFPRCAAVVHHGGAGTTHAATLAGVPSIVVAHSEEQRFWGAELKRIGAAPAPLLWRSLTARALAGRISQVLRSPAMTAGAQAAAATMRTEDGVGTAVALIEQTFGTRADGHGVSAAR